MKNSMLITKELQNILNVIGDGIYITDKDGNTLFINQMYEKLAGIDSKNIIGKNIADLQTEGFFDVVLNPQVVNTKKPASTVQKLRGEVEVALNARPVFDVLNNVQFVVTIARDVTLIAQLKEQVAEQKESMDNFLGKMKLLNLETDGTPIIGDDENMRNILEKMEKIAITDATMLLLGETGVGKDVFSHFIHSKSTRKNNAFLKVDCTSIPENLIESELFGYAPGSFSGASAKGKQGYFELADKGTLFLDEIGELPLALQGKLLRVLQDQEIARVGEGRARKIDVRIIAATNRDLEEEVRKGNFRSDLFYRLRVAVLTIPPLRERAQSIKPLAEFFFEKYCSKYKKTVRYTNELFSIFEKYPWPGNVRELENLIQSLIVTANTDAINFNDLPSNMLEKNSLAKLKETQNAQLSNLLKLGSLKNIVGNLEKDIIKKSIEEYGSINKAAEKLQINRSTLFRKCQIKEEDNIDTE